MNETKNNNTRIIITSETTELELKTANEKIIFDAIYAFSFIEKTKDNPDPGFYGGFNFFKGLIPITEKTYYTVVNKLIKLDLITEKKFSTGKRILRVKAEVIERLQKANKKLNNEDPKLENEKEQTKDKDNAVDPYDMRNG